MRAWNYSLRISEADQRLIHDRNSADTLISSWNAKIVKKISPFLANVAKFCKFYIDLILFRNSSSCVITMSSI